MTSVTKLEKAVLLALAEYDEEYAVYMKTIAVNLDLDYAETRRRIRRIARKGLAVLVRGLTDEYDGMLRGSGYQLTLAGRKLAKTFEEPAE
ncbi:hypothetical protein GOC60_14580 [Sinorhizobium meliloti]|nr:hypothetical protein [Sinorhizobium meliloti]